jgi:hypothetical protein
MTGVQLPADFGSVCFCDSGAHSSHRIVACDLKDNDLCSRRDGARQPGKHAASGVPLMPALMTDIGRPLARKISSNWAG